MAAKKRKEAPQSNNILSFFGTPNKKPKTPAETKEKRKKSGPKLSEIIVIDSDSDEEIVRSCKGKARQWSQSAILASSKGKVRAGDGPSSVTASSSKLSVSVKAEQGDLFGKPHLLCPPLGESDVPTFVPTGLLGITPSLKQEPPLVLELSDDEIEWLNADGEQLGDDEDDEITIIEPGPSKSHCPVCSQSLKELDESGVQTHVNGCLDSTNAEAGPSRLPPKPKTPKPMKLLSELKTPHGNPSAFAVLMASHKEGAAWKEADVAEDNWGKRATSTKRRSAPFYKVLQGMPIAVDAFKYGAIPYVKAYFLTHAHSDHYTNLSSTWKHGPIYCSHGTANLIIHMLSVDRKWVHPLPFNTPYTIPDTGGVRVTLIEANHCPGSSLFLYEGQQTVNAGDSTFKSPFIGSTREFRYLHCGDFRASPVHVEHPSVKGKRIDHVYLDTTYLDPKYVFPPQPLVITACADLAKSIVEGTTGGEEEGGPNTIDTWAVKPEAKEGKIPKKENILFIVGTYSIGKERIVKAVAKALNSKIYCDARKAAILRCEEDPELEAMLTKKPLESNVHLIPLQMVTSDKIKIYIEKYKGKYTRVVGLRPTGWSYSPPAGSEQIPAIHDVITRSQQRGYTHNHLHPARNSTSTLQIYGVPYSEHSSFFELTCFALSIEWVKMIATVNVGSESSRGKMNKWFEKWEAERKKRNKVAVKNRAPDHW